MNKALAPLVLIATLAFAASPYLSQNFAGYPPDLFPVPQVDPPVQPAGWAFAIWGLLYLWLIASALFGLIRRAGDAEWQRMRPALLASLGIGIFWLDVAGRAPGWATAMILAMMALAVLAMLRAGGNDRFWLVMPVALYAGWLTAASGASLGIVLGGYGLLSAQAAAIICLIAVAVLALAVQLMRSGALAYSAAVIWALLGVAGANLSPLNPAVVMIAAMGTILLAGRAMLARTLR